MNFQELLHQTIIAAVLAGDEILKVYDTDFNVEYKQDKSPVTKADKNASDKIIEVLNHFNIPLLSEEGDQADFETRKNWNRLWIVDPLDGTKEFVKRNGEFTVNIALIEDNVPILGVIYSPVFKDIYFSAKGIGAYKINHSDFIPFIETISACTLENLFRVAKKLPIVSNRKNYVVVASRSHMSSETHYHIEDIKHHHQNVEIVSTGSSIKLCWVAEGIADEYPRFGPTMEWDTAAGQAILQESQCNLIDFKTNQVMKYNREDLLNNWFIAKRL
jgi:3'(2'), 5'-bisphosphate nucleotidase